MQSSPAPKTPSPTPQILNPTASIPFSPSLRGRGTVITADMSPEDFLIGLWFVVQGLGFVVYGF